MTIGLRPTLITLACSAVDRIAFVSVAPVEVVEDPVGVLVVEVDLSGVDLEGAHAALAPLPDETIVEGYGRLVRLARYGVLERRTNRFHDPWKLNRALYAFGLYVEIRFDHARHGVRRTEDLPGHSLEGPGEDLG